MTSAAVSKAKLPRQWRLVSEGERSRRVHAETRDRLDSIQILRAVAALLVVTHHAIQRGAPPAYALQSKILPHIPSFTAFGAAGVDLFFVISGFVMAHSVGCGRQYGGAARFLASRAFRILPLFWLMSAVYALQLLLSGASINLYSLLNSITLVPMFEPVNYHYPILYVGWSLGFELAFYFLVAVSLRFEVDRRAAYLFGLTAAAAAIGYLIRPSAPTMAFWFNPIVGEFALGIGAWMLWRRGLPPWLTALLALGGLMLFLSGIFIDLGQGFGIDPVTIISGETSAKRMIVWGVPATMLLLGFVCSTSFESKVSAVLVKIGGASYSLYLLHPIIDHQVQQADIARFFMDPYIFLAFLILATVALAVLLHNVVEKPLLGLAHNVLRRSGAKG